MLTSSPDIMETLSQFIIACAPLLLACAWPFVRIVRGRQVFGSFFLCWALLVAWHVVLIVVLPLVLYDINMATGRAFSNLVPEGPAVVAITFMGWFPAGIAVVLAILVRDLSRYLNRKLKRVS